MSIKKGFLDKIKGLLQKKAKDQDDDTTDPKLALDQLPPELRQKLESGDEEDWEDEEDIEESIPDFRPMEIQRSQEDDNLDQTNPSIPVSEGTREMDLPEEEDPDLKAVRLKAIRDNAYDEDDFEEHSGINEYKEFKVPSETGRKLRSLGLWVERLKGYVQETAVKLKDRSPQLKKVASKGEKFQWDKLFAPQERPRIHRIFLALFLICGTYTMGKMIALVVTSTSTPTTARRLPPPALENTGPTTGQLMAVSRVDLFNANKRQSTLPQLDSGPQVDETLVCVQSNQATRLPIKLVNTIVLQDSVKSIAAVQVRGGRNMINIREGQKIENLAEVGKIDRMQLVLKNLSTGQCEYVKTDNRDQRRPTRPIQVVSEQEGQKILSNQSNAGIKNEGNSFKIQKTVRDQMLQNISEVLTQARAVQITNPDGTMAFKMTEIVPGSIYSQLNIQDGDIIEGINGNPITNLNEVMSMFGRIREIDNLSITVRRNGAVQNLDYSFE